MYVCGRNFYIGRIQRWTFRKLLGVTWELEQNLQLSALGQWQDIWEG
jgi:hypothetical protein